MNDIDKLRIELLAKNGGFSARGIAHQVFGFSASEESEEARLIRQAVRSYLGRNKIRLRAWRDIESILAKQHARQAVKVKKRPRYRKSA